MMTPTHPSTEQQLELFAEGPFTLRLTIQDAVRIFWDNYWQFVACAKTTEIHLTRIRTFFRGQYLDTISKADVERFRRHLKEMGYAEPTINKAHMILSRIFRKMEEYKEGRSVNGVDFSKITLPAKNPASLVPKVKEAQFSRKVVLSKDDITKLISYSDENLAETIKALYWTRLRPSDLKRITDGNIDFKNMAITGIQHKTISNSNPSGVPYRVAMNVDLAALIQRRMQAHKPGTPLFPWRTISFRWKRVRDLAGMPHVQLRDLRRSAATFLIDSGVDLETVREGLGHTSLRCLPTYTPRTQKHLADATEKLVEV
jgi:integrase